MTRGPILIIVTGAADACLITGRREAPIEDQIDELPPVMQGKGGRAWQIDLDALRKRIGEDKPDATIGEWLIECPSAHPLWHSYVIALISMRPVVGLDTPIFFLDGATHEILLVALDPTKPRLPIILGEVSFLASSLEPLNFAAQFIEIDDALAIDRIRKTVADICAGGLNPDTDNRSSWEMRFGGI